MLPKRQRLTVRDIEGLSAGKSAFTALISLRYRPADRLKLSVSVSKKALPGAVDRNRLRRRIYSLFAKIAPQLREPVHALLSPKRELLDAPSASLEHEVRAVFDKARLI